MKKWKNERYLHGFDTVKIKIKIKLGKAFSYVVISNFILFFHDKVVRKWITNSKRVDVLIVHISLSFGVE
jgi:hypothetical protein